MLDWGVKCISVHWVLSWPVQNPGSLVKKKKKSLWLENYTCSFIPWMLIACYMPGHWSVTHSDGHCVWSSGTPQSPRQQWYPSLWSSQSVGVIEVMKNPWFTSVARISLSTLSWMDVVEEEANELWLVSGKCFFFLCGLKSLGLMCL